MALIGTLFLIAVSGCSERQWASNESEVVASNIKVIVKNSLCS